MLVRPLRSPRQTGLYPNPDGTNGLQSGSHHYWANNPPLYEPHLNRNCGGVYNLDGYCRSLGYVRARLDGMTAYDWSCVTTAGSKVGIDTTRACNWQYNASGLVSLTKDFKSPYSWRCYGQRVGKVISLAAWGSDQARTRCRGHTSARPET